MAALGSSGFRVFLEGLDFFKVSQALLSANKPPLFRMARTPQNTEPVSRLRVPVHWRQIAALLAQFGHPHTARPQVLLKSYTSVWTVRRANCQGVGAALSVTKSTLTRAREVLIRSQLSTKTHHHIKLPGRSAKQTANQRTLVR